MKSLAKSRILLGGALIFAGFALAALTLPTSLLIDVLNGAFTGIAVTVGAVYAPLTWNVFSRRNFDRTSQLALGIACVWLSAVLARGFSIYFRAVGSPERLTDSPVIALVALIATVGGALHITAPGFNAEPIINMEPVKFGGDNMRLVLLACAIGAIVGLILHFN